MFTHRTALIGLAAAVVLAGGVLVTAAQATSPGTAATAESTLTTQLRFARDEERMARDLYQALADRYDGAMPFAMITRSEQQHFDAVGTLLVRYDIGDPADGKKAGTYADPRIQDLYDGWLADGQKSLDAAYDVGVALEKRDIADLEGTLAGDPPADVKQVFTALLNGSQHHLAAFEAAADGQSLGTQQGQGRGYGPGMMNRQGNGPGQGRGYGMMNGWRNGGGPGNGAGFDGDCPMLDQS
jgi:hypothetical protein